MSSIITILKIAVFPRTSPPGTPIFNTENVQNVLCIWSNAAHLPKFDIHVQKSFHVSFLPFAHMRSAIGQMCSAIGQTSRI